MKIIKDIRETFVPDFHSRPKTRTIEGIELGDVQGRTVQDINPTAPDRSEISTVKPKEK